MCRCTGPGAPFAVCTRACMCAYVIGLPWNKPIRFPPSSVFCCCCDLSRQYSVVALLHKLDHLRVGREVPRRLSQVVLRLDVAVFSQPLRHVDGLDTNSLEERGRPLRIPGLFAWILMEACDCSLPHPVCATTSHGGAGGRGEAFR